MVGHSEEKMENRMQSRMQTQEKNKKNNSSSLRKKFDKMTSGPFGYVVYAIGGILIAFLLNQVLAFGLDTDLPVVAVVSGSMTHDDTTPQVHYKWLQDNLGYNHSVVDSWSIKDGFLVGDLPIVEGSKDYNVGDVIVYNVPGQNVPIVHRIIRVNSDGSFTTKGDHNPNLLPFEGAVKKEQIHGKVIFIIPKLGYFKVVLTKFVGAAA